MMARHGVRERIRQHGMIVVGSVQGVFYGMNNDYQFVGILLGKVAFDCILHQFTGQ